jgi:hypothetical protein
MYRTFGAETGFDGHVKISLKDNERKMCSVEVERWDRWAM